MSKLYFSLIFLFIVFQKGNGQSLEKGVTSEKSYFAKKVTARFNFTGVADPYDQNISVGGEYRFNPHWSVGSDVAYIFKSYYLSESKYARGIILRPFIRYYFEKNRNGFLEAVINYKYVSYEITDWIGKEISNGMPAYEEYSTFHFIKKTYGLNFKAGTAANLTRDERLRLEFYAGLGIRFKNQGADIGSYTRRRGLFGGLYDPKYSTVVLPMGMRLVYDIK